MINNSYFLLSFYDVLNIMLCVLYRLFFLIFNIVLEYKDNYLYFISNENKVKNKVIFLKLI